MEMTEKQRQGLAAFDAFLEVFTSRYKRGWMTIRCLEVFTRVTTRPGQTYFEIAQSMETQPHLIYNDLAQLGRMNASGFPGLFLIEERRLNHVKRIEHWPTDKGQGLWADALGAWEYGLLYGRRMPLRTCECAVGR